MYLLLTTHGQFAHGILESYRMIAGDNKQIHSLILDDDGIESYQARLFSWLQEKDGQDVVILSDLKGGTPYNECFKYYLSHLDKVRLLSGLNLGMLLEIGLQINQIASIDDLASLALTAGKDAVSIAGNSDEEDELEF